MGAGRAGGGGGAEAIGFSGPQALKAMKAVTDSPTNSENLTLP